MAEADEDQHQDELTRRLTQQLASVTRRLPAFWPADPELWFAQIEQEFARRNITSQTTKFREVVTSLSSTKASEVHDIVISPPAQDPYDHLNNELIRRTIASEQRRLQQLLTIEELGDRKPSQLLRRMKQLLGNQASAMDTSILRQLVLQRLPSNVRMILTTSGNICIDDLAELADKLHDAAPHNIQGVVQSTSDWQQPRLSTSGPTPEEFRHLQENVAMLVDKVAAIRQRYSRAPEAPRAKRLPSPCPSREQQLCWYDKKFGTQAHHCAPPCSWSKENDRSSY